jgi:ABC-type multidrug transport system fused ATPase/permease subunit
MHLASVSASILAVSKLLRLSHWDPQGPGTVTRTQLKRAIRFEHVSFAYSGKNDEVRNAITDVTLEFPIGRVTGIVGWSGAGKSTLTNLLFRFYDPSKGTISVDGVPLPRLDLVWWRSQLAIAGQDAELVGGTIRDNIAYGKENATFEEIVEAAQRACIHDFILTLPQGYETQVGGRGALLSGGQRQRIGLARALVRRSAILVLDEATNSVDSMTEAEILRSLEELRGQMTIIVIAHRLSTTRTADHVIALAEGRVAEAGSPAELLRRKGLYAQMVQLQEQAHLRPEPLEILEKPVESLLP